MYPDCLCRGGESGSTCILIVSVGMGEWEYMYPDCLCRGGRVGVHVS